MPGYIASHKSDAASIINVCHEIANQLAKFANIHQQLLQSLANV